MKCLSMKQGISLYFILDKLRSKRSLVMKFAILRHITKENFQLYKKLDSGASV